MTSAKECLKRVRDIMQELKVSRRIIEYAVESLGLEATKWVGGIRYFNSNQVSQIRKKITSGRRVFMNRKELEEG